jgi:hypothetical protein
MMPKVLEFHGMYNNAPACLLMTQVLYCWPYSAFLRTSIKQSAAVKISLVHEGRFNQSC